MTDAIPSAGPEAICLLALLLIGALPRVFFRRGRLNLRWWLTASPFIADGALLLLGMTGVVRPLLPPGSFAGVAAGWLAVLAAGGAIAWIGFTLGSHVEPVSLWHQPDDTPRRLVTRGAYARIRHPFYAAFLLVLAACALALPHPATLAILLLGAVQLDRTAAREERRLLASAVGAEYAEYMRRTGRFRPRPQRITPPLPPP